MRWQRRNEGFTLIEIIIVVLIISLLLAIAIPNFLRAREISRARTCQSNLRSIMTAKEQWAIDLRQPALAVPTETDLVTEYIKNCYEDTLPSCPSNGTYTIGNLLTPPSCNIGANLMPTATDDHILKQ